MRRRAVVHTLGAALVTAVLTLPTAWLVLSSFKTRVDLLSLPPKVVFAPTLENYRTAFVERGFLGDLCNSLAVALGSSVLAVVLAYPAAMVLARLREPLRGHLLFFILSTRLVPPVALGLPLHLLYRDLGLLDTVTGLVLAHGAFNLSFAVWMIVAFSERLGTDLFEAFELDGIGPWKSCTALLPALSGSLILVSFFCFVFSWNELFLAAVLTEGRVRTLPIGILGLVTSQGTLWDQFCAVASVTLIPVLILGWFLRKSAADFFSLGGAEVERA